MDGYNFKIMFAFFKIKWHICLTYINTIEMLYTGLGGGAIAGIVICCLAVPIIIVIIVVLYIKRATVRKAYGTLRNRAPESR
jgi:hypothetical protein